MKKNIQYQLKHLNPAVDIIHKYQGEQPLTSFLKQYFKLNKNIGSNDRKAITELVYTYYRLQYVFNNMDDVEEKLVYTHFISQNQSTSILEKLLPNFLNDVSKSSIEKLELFNKKRDDAFQFLSLLSPQINTPQFIQNFLQPPNVFLRSRPNKTVIVKNKLEKAGIAYKQLTDTAFMVNAGAPVDQAITLNQDAVIQDLASQQVFEVTNWKKHIPATQLDVWDVCIASGGKTILWHDDALPTECTFLGTDVRKSILLNCNKRLQQADIRTTHLKEWNVAKSTLPDSRLYDIIICDVPCSGSGTWARTPERATFFKTSDLKYFTHLQQNIIKNALPKLKPNGLFFYITCSVFQLENEDIVNNFAQQNNLEILHQQYIAFPEYKSDTMFVTLLMKAAKK